MSPTIFKHCIGENVPFLNATYIIYPVNHRSGTEVLSLVTPVIPVFMRIICILGYHGDGFLALQHAISNAITFRISGRDPSELVDVTMNQFPYPPYEDDMFIEVLKTSLPMIIMLSFLYHATIVVKCIVHEKENRLKVTKTFMIYVSYFFWL